MGAEQSTNRTTRQGSQTPAAVQKTCYYELLSIAQTATDEEVKKAYRRKALELHPDRNLHDTATATRRFAEVQTAYEILSDPQERAWYDSHRDAILRGNDGTSDDDAVATDRFYNNVRLTSTEDIYALMGRFNSSVAFSDAPNGFFGILNETFAHLAREEEAACQWDCRVGDEPFDYPSFGSATDSYNDVAKPFYRVWFNFATRKSFNWVDKYRLSDAPDRAVRRVMEKENKKARETAAREFNDAVRSFVAFVRKRDPRYVPNKQSEAERQKILRDSATAQAARQRAANQERRQQASAYVEPEWARSRVGSEHQDEYEGGFSSDAETEIQEEIECVVCDKSFKSEKQFEAHEKSKKHIKAVHQLQRQMKKENLDFSLDTDERKMPSSPPELAEEKQEDTVSSSVVESREDQHDPGEDNDSDKDEDEDENDEYAPRAVVETRFLIGQDELPSGNNVDDPAPDLDSLYVENETPPGAIPRVQKVGKAKAKRSKKAARAAAMATDLQSGAKTTCSICSEAFSSNTKLHQHLKTKHPILTSLRKSSRGGGKKSES